MQEGEQPLLEEEEEEELDDELELLEEDELLEPPEVHFSFTASIPSKNPGMF